MFLKIKIFHILVIYLVVDDLEGLAYLFLQTSDGNNPDSFLPIPLYPKIWYNRQKVVFAFGVKYSAVHAIFLEQYAIGHCILCV